VQAISMTKFIAHKLINLLRKKTVAKSEDNIRPKLLKQVINQGIIKRLSDSFNLKHISSGILIHPLCFKDSLFKISL